MTEPSGEHILLFGGSFDPPHRAHIELPLRIAETLGVDRLIFIPAGVSPHKTDAPPVDPAHRVAMLKVGLAATELASSIKTEVSMIEINRAGPSYFIDTLRECARMHRNARFSFLMGSDQLLSFTSWKDWQDVLKRADPVVMLRPPDTEASLVEELASEMDEATITWWLDRIAEAPKIDVSSTRIRSHDNASKRSAIDDAIDAYIQQHDLYRAP